MVCVTVPGERWEIEFLADGSVEVERFISESEIYGEDILGALFTRLLCFGEYQVNYHLAMAVCCLANKVAKISTACCPRWSCSWA